MSCSCLSKSRKKHGESAKLRELCSLQIVHGTSSREVALRRRLVHELLTVCEDEIGRSEENRMLWPCRGRQHHQFFRNVADAQSESHSRNEKSVLIERRTVVALPRKENQLVRTIAVDELTLTSNAQSAGKVAFPSRNSRSASSTLPKFSLIGFFPAIAPQSCAAPRQKTLAAK